MNQHPNKPHAVRRPTPDSRRGQTKQQHPTDHSAIARHPRARDARSDLQNNLKSQTPLNRRMRQKMAAPADPGTIRRATKPQYYRIKDDSPGPRSRGLSVFGRRLLLVLLSYAVLMPLCLLAFSFVLPHHSTPETNDFVYQIGPDKGYYARHVYKWHVVRTGSTYYVNMTELAAYCQMSTTGDDTARRYIVKKTGETVEFMINESIAYVNGIQERTGGDAYIRDENVYVPLDFVNRCFDGIDATVDLEKAKITILQQSDDEGEPVTISFPYKPVTTTNAIRFADLSHDLQLEILIQNQPTTPVAPDDNLTEYNP